MLAIAEDALLTAVVRMKKNKMKYRHSQYTPDKIVYKEMDLATMYRSEVRKQWEKVPGQPYQSKTIVVELNLNDSKEEAARWIKVRLVFVRGVAESDNKQPGKHDWVVFLSTDSNLEPQKILESLLHALGYRGVFQRVQAAFGIPQGTVSPLCLLCRIDPLDCNTVLFIGHSQAATRCQWCCPDEAADCGQRYQN